MLLLLLLLFFFFNYFYYYYWLSLLLICARQFPRARRTASRHTRAQDRQAVPRLPTGWEGTRLQVAGSQRSRADGWGLNPYTLTFLSIHTYTHTYKMDGIQISSVNWTPTPCFYLSYCLLYRIWRQAGYFFFYVCLLSLSQYSINVKWKQNICSLSVVNVVKYVSLTLLWSPGFRRVRNARVQRVWRHQVLDSLGVPAAGCY